MSTTEILGLVTLIITLAGWGATYLIQRGIQASQNAAQRDITQLQHSFALDQERRRYLVPSRLQQIDSLAEWVDEGITLWLDAKMVNQRADADRAAYGKDIDPVLGRLDAWILGGSRHHAFARQFDPSYSLDASEWEWGTKPLPEDLPRLLISFQLEVGLKVKEKLVHPDKREVERADTTNATREVYEAILSAAERLREVIVAPHEQLGEQTG